MFFNVFFYLLVCIISFILAHYVIRKKPRTPLNQTFVLFVLVIAYWAGTGFGFRQSDTQREAILWLRLGGFWPLTYGFLLHFVLILTDKSRLLNRKVIYGPLYAPPVIFSVLDSTTNLITGNPTIGYWGWTIEAPEFSFLYYTSLYWQFLVGGVALAFCIHYIVHTESSNKRQQVKFVTFGLIVPFVFTVVSELIKVIFRIQLPEVIMPGIALGSLFIGYAIQKYELFVLSPSTAADRITSIISDFLLLINPEGKLKMVNESALIGLEYSKEELLGENVNKIFDKKQNILVFKEEGLKNLQKNPISNIETYLTTKSGKRIPVTLSASVIQDSKNNIIGIICIARDLTQKKQIEYALSESDRAFNQLFEAIPDPSYLWKKQVNGLITLERVNKATFLSTKGKIDEYIGKDLESFYRYNKEIPRKIKHILETGEIVREAGAYYSTITDEKKWLLVDYLKIFKDSVLIVTKDLTEQIQTEQDLKREKEFSESILEVVNALVIGVDRHGDIILFNRTAEKITGYTKEEVMGLNWFTTFLPSTSQSTILSYLLTGEGTDPIHLEGDIITKSGERRYISWNNTVIKDANGDITGVVGLGDDITEEKRNQQVIESLNMASQKIQNLTDSSAILPVIGEELKKYGFRVFILSQENKEQFISFSHITAPQEAEIIKELLDIDLLGCTFPLPDIDIIKKVTEDHESIYVDDIFDLLINLFNIDNKDILDLIEAIQWKKLIIAPLMLKNQAPRFFCVGSNVLSHRDVPAVTSFAHQAAATLENAQLYEQLRKAHTDLVDLTKNLENKVQKRTEELSRANKLTSEFLANISHEFRTPLNAIMSFTEILLMKLDGTLNPQQEEDLLMIRESGRDLLSLINTILDLSKIENGKLELHIEPIQISEMVSSVISQVIMRIIEKGLTLKTDFPENQVVIMADESRLKQVLRNLLDNALKFTKQGEIIIGFQLEGDQVIFKVKDTGIGIREEDHQIIFDKFRQAEGGMTREYGGTGLGLSVARELVILHGGKIWLESEIGRGSTFYFSIPCKKDEKKTQRFPID
ncbi:MAG: PAS domain S-box protein [Theionarchaea archaeon]|nr:PAS domain S-box protein [Theionarchaea archaeon]